MKLTLGILHPGEMGTCLATTALNTLGKVYWCSQGRSPASRARAAQACLSEIPTLQEFASLCEVIVSVCPPHAATSQAQQLIALQYQGIYVDANAIAPATVMAISEQCEAAGMHFVDGGIIGVPGTTPGSTWLYLSGARAAEVEKCFSAGPFATRTLGPDPGQASALKMCYAAWNKGKTALFTAVMAAAQSLDVREALEQQFEMSEPGFVDSAQQRVRQVARKAWRFSGEMQEIAATLEQCQLPGGFFTAAAQIYGRQAGCKDASQAPELVELLELVTGQRGK